MFLKSLRIEGNEGLIREITFKKGVNLIVDNSPGQDDSGNNVGKTTIIRLIDYCLGGKGENIFKDPEFKTISEIKDFLIEKEVLLTLVLVRSLDVTASPKIIVERNFLSHSDKILRIDGEKYTLQVRRASPRHWLKNFSILKRRGRVFDKSLRKTLETKKTVSITSSRFSMLAQPMLSMKLSISFGLECKPMRELRIKKRKMFSKARGLSGSACQGIRRH